LNQVPIYGLESTVQVIARDIEDSVSQAAMPRAEEALIYELICCILSSQVPYDLAISATECLIGDGLAQWAFVLPVDELEQAVTTILLKPLHTPSGSRRYRFPHRKAREIASAFERFRLSQGSIAEFLRQYPEPAKARHWLVENISGLGPKQASMFLRNAGHSRDLAILDRHILKYMRLIQISDLGAGVSRLKDYEKEERRFADHAALLGFPVGILDSAVWIVLRAAAQLEGAAGW